MSDFLKEINGEFNGITKQLNRAMSNTAIEGLGFLTSRAAVRTGRYRASWNLSKNNPDNSVRREKKKPAGWKPGDDLYGFTPRSRILFDVRVDKSVILANNLDYAPYVDAKYGDVMTTKLKMQSALNRRVKNIK